MVIDNKYIESLSSKYGFDLTGFSKVEKLTKEIDNLKIWLYEGYNSGMEYMSRNIEKREDIRNFYPSAVSVISLGKNYYTNNKYDISENEGKISKYAFNKDYHLVLWEKLDKMIAEIKETDPSFDAIYYVDTGPVMDKVWANKSGLGWIGKNTNLINREKGSWFFIANIICNYEFKYSQGYPDLCGDCTRCIDACPTDAIVRPYVVDGGKCISYLTIENKGDIPEEFIGKMDNWVFGCDVCQDVCPWNLKFSTETEDLSFHPIYGRTQISLDEIEKMDEIEFKEMFKDSPVKRAKLKGLKRNARFLRKKT